MGRILVVDDDEMDRELSRTVLQAAGHVVIFAREGESALAVCEEKTVDLVVTDLAMPDFNGLRFIMAFRKAGYETPIIALSGKAADQLDLAEDYGANLTLCKPIDGQKLLNCVQELLDTSDAEARSEGDVWGRGI